MRHKRGIETPLQYIAVHIIESTAIRHIGAYRHRAVVRGAVLIWKRRTIDIPAVVPVAPDIVHVRALVEGSEVLAVVEVRRRAGATGVLPLRPGGEVERVEAGLLAQDADEGIGGNTLDIRPVVSIRIAADHVPGDLLHRARGVVRFVGEPARAIALHKLPLLLRRLEDGAVERVRDFRLRCAAHLEGSRPDEAHRELRGAVEVVREAALGFGVEVGDGVARGVRPAGEVDDAVVGHLEVRHGEGDVGGGEVDALRREVPRHLVRAVRARERVRELVGRSRRERRRGRHVVRAGEVVRGDDGEDGRVPAGEARPVPVRGEGELHLAVPRPAHRRRDVGDAGPREDREGGRPASQPREEHRDGQGRRPRVHVVRVGDRVVRAAPERHIHAFEGHGDFGLDRLAGPRVAPAVEAADANLREDRRHRHVVRGHGEGGLGGGRVGEVHAVASRPLDKRMAGFGLVRDDRHDRALQCGRVRGAAADDRHGVELRRPRPHEFLPFDAPGDVLLRHERRTVDRHGASRIRTRRHGDRRSGGRLDRHRPARTVRAAADADGASAALRRHRTAGDRHHSALTVVAPADAGGVAAALRRHHAAVDRHRAAGAGIPPTDASAAVTACRRHLATVDRHRPAGVATSPADAGGGRAALRRHLAAVDRHRPAGAAISPADAGGEVAASSNELPGAAAFRSGVGLHPDGKAVGDDDLPSVHHGDGNVHVDARVGRERRTVREDEVHVAGDLDAVAARFGTRDDVPAGFERRMAGVGGVGRADLVGVRGVRRVEIADGGRIRLARHDELRGLHLPRDAVRAGDVRELVRAVVRDAPRPLALARQVLGDRHAVLRDRHRRVRAAVPQGREGERLVAPACAGAGAQVEHHLRGITRMRDPGSRHQGRRDHCLCHSHRATS